MTTTSPHSAADPALDALVPHGRRWHAVAGGAAVVALLGAAWASPAVLRPSLDGGSSGSGGVFVPLTDDEVLVLTLVTPDAAAPFTLEAVGDVPGAHVVEAWLVTGDAVDGLSSSVGAPTDGPVDAATALAAVPDLAAAALPVRVPAQPGEVGLLVRWAVDDCAALTAAGPADPATPPELRLRTVIGTRVERPAPDLAALDAGLLGDDEAGGPCAA
ncbi:hypothetical protein [Cellulomonas marina]|uniref:Uncharacterized protein n=1 Tax=Cellulomonas marina TaxID=988821 RepID=A0A1I0WWU0_9CELL|nr:hypothetical protein [Cellulomonas marina]GIG30366.1 hypothetical protein Cma02nite_29660 [Cellulomonas marina]SFA92516.1 hypothetical protein SAMN05421867_103262 [Cellulomonas marina]